MQIDAGWDTWGALALVFSNPSLRAFLSDRLVLDHRHHGPHEGLKNIDSVVGSWCQRVGLAYFVHVPSLAQHTGETSTLYAGSPAEARRQCGAFVRDVAELPGCS